MTELVIFDMDGLMFDTEAVTCRSFMERASELGYGPTMEQYVQLLGLNSTDIQKKYTEFFGEQVDAKELYKTVGARKDAILEEEGVPVKKGLESLLECLEKKKIPKAIASGSSKKEIETYLKATGLTGRFDLLLSTKEVNRGKPFPDVFLEICHRLEVRPENALVLEDSQNGIKAAVAGGIPVIGIPDLLQIPEDLKKQCLAVAESLFDVILYL